MNDLPSEPCTGEPAHLKVLEQFHKLTCSDGLLVQTVQHVKASNNMVRQNSKRLHWMGMLLFMYLLPLGILLLFVSRSATDIQHADETLRGTVRQLEEVTASLVELQSSLADVKKDTTNIKDEQLSQPKVELIPEPDPVKAKTAPIKVRITPPPSSGHSPPAPSMDTVEVPIPARDTMPAP
jgi:hypothetical protein